MDSPRPLVLIDDDEDDLFVLHAVLHTASATHPVRAFHGAEDAMAFMSASVGSRPAYGVALPLACFVDVRMPGFDGFEFIEWVRNHGVFDVVPLVVLSASDEPGDLRRAAALGAQAYLLKFPAAPAMRHVVHAIEAYRTAPNPRAVFEVPANLFLGRAPLPRVAPQ